jgi:hypothetical protein
MTNICVISYEIVPFQRHVLWNQNVLFPRLYIYYICHHLFSLFGLRTKKNWVDFIMLRFHLLKSRVREFYFRYTYLLQNFIFLFISVNEKNNKNKIFTLSLSIQFKKKFIFNKKCTYQKLFSMVTNSKKTLICDNKFE